MGIIRYFLELLNILIAIAIFVGVPYITWHCTGNPGTWMFIVISWIPALLIWSALSDRVDNIKD